MWLMLQQAEPADYVIATGVDHSVRELCEIAFAAGRPRLRATTSSSIRRSSGRPRSTTSWATPHGRATVLGWEPEVDFRGLVEMMVDADVERWRRATGDPRGRAGSACSQADAAPG